MLLSASCQNDEAAAKEMAAELDTLRKLMDGAKNLHRLAHTTWSSQQKDMDEGDDGVCGCRVPLCSLHPKGK